MPPDAEKNSRLSANWAVQEVDQLIARFSRYTRFVLYSKWSLAVLALLLMVVLIAWPYFTRDTTGVRVSFVGATKDMQPQPNLMPRLTNPRYESTTTAGDSFIVTGAVAIQQSASLVIVEKVSGQLVKKDGSWLSLSADRAEYEQGKHLLLLVGNVNVVNDAGYNFITPSARVDTKSMQVTGDQGIEGTGPQGKLLASRFEITDNGKTINVGGAGRVTIEFSR